MNRSTGYMLALCAGVSLGWLAQQFWFAGLDQHVSKSERDLLRNEQRLKVLKSRQEREIASSIEIIGSSAEESSLQVQSDELLADNLASKDEIKKVDFQLALKFAKSRFSQGDTSESLLYLYDLRPQVDYQYEAEYLALIHDFVQSLERQLEDAGNAQALISMYQQLVSLEPEYVPYYLSLTQWLIVSKAWSEAEQSLIPAKFDIRFREEVEILENMIVELRERSNQYVVPLKTIGEHYLAELFVEDTHALSLMLDTGASMTVVKSAFMLENYPLLMDGAEDLKLKTANGVVDGYKVIVPSISLSGLSMSDVTLGVLPLDDFGYDGLLGMDILKRFEFNIDQENQQLILNP